MNSDFMSLANEEVDYRRLMSLNDAPVGQGAVLYVMGRDQRINDNWPLLYAAFTAKKRGVPLLVLFVVGPMFNHGSLRHNEWLIASLKEVEQNLSVYGIPFYVEVGDWVKKVVGFVKKHQVGQVVFDFNPLEPVRSWREVAAKELRVKAEVVDGRNIVPCFVASTKAEFAAYTFRPKIHRLLPEFLSEFPSLPKMNLVHSGPPPDHDWEKVAAYRKVGKDIGLPSSFVPGEAAALMTLSDFLENRLDGYADKRNDPNENSVSNLSPYLRWGNISAQRVALLIQASRQAKKEDRDAFLEELIVRRELADNYVYYTPKYDTIDGAHPWAQATLLKHRSDKREHVYTIEEFADAKTHDELWNAMQRQMVKEGKMHGWCRMYWAKKILEWTNSPEEAIDIALTLNDRFELDGRDSNGVAGVMWSIAGVHDRAWNERSIFGKIRYMNFAGAKRKFDVASYIARYSVSNQPLF